MKTLISIIVILFAVGCSNQDAEIKNLTDAYTKLQTENTRIHEELKSLREEYRRLVAVGNPETLELMNIGLKARIKQLEMIIERLEQKVEKLEEDK